MKVRHSFKIHTPAAVRTVGPRELGREGAQTRMRLAKA